VGLNSRRRPRRAKSGVKIRNQLTKYFLLGFFTPAAPRLTIQIARYKQYYSIPTVLNFSEALLVSIEGFPLGFHCLRDGVCAGSWPNSIWLIRSDGTSSMMGVNSPEVPAGELRACASVLSLAGGLFISTIWIVFF
jgi:hypothetical protein